MVCTSKMGFRLQAVPFWSVEMVSSQRSETGARRNKREEAGGEKEKKANCNKRVRISRCSSIGKFRLVHKQYLLSNKFDM